LAESSTKMPIALLCTAPLVFGFAMFIRFVCSYFFFLRSPVIAVIITSR
jgi:hypothetical protein